ncbi:hypothetical protein [Streptomyces sp. NPDC048425]
MTSAATAPARRLWPDRPSTTSRAKARSLEATPQAAAITSR